MSILHKISSNWKSGLTVAMVSIPLSISLAVASNTTPIAGIITAIWAGFIASIFGGSNYNIIGPTGALSGILALHAITYGASTLPTIAIISGFIVLLAYVLHLEKFLYFISASTVHGFTLGVACMISISQINAILGLHNLPAHRTIFENLQETYVNLNLYSEPTVILFFIFLAVLFLLRMHIPSFPNIMIITPIGILIGYLTSHSLLPFSLFIVRTKFGHITPLLYEPITLTFNHATLQTSCIVALIALLETMISARIADNITKTKHHQHKEILGLGLANIVSGIMGGIPATAALARTSLNIKAGACNKMSATINSIGMAILSLIFLSYFEYLPLAVIAAILVYVSICMIDVYHFQKLYMLDKHNFIVALVVAAITLYQDPTMGIISGVALSSILLLHALSKEQFELNHNINQIKADIVSSKMAAEIFFYSFKGELTFINSQAHIAHFEDDLNSYTTVILRFKDVTFIDFDGVEAISYIINLLHAAHKKIIITSINPLILSMLKHSHHVLDLEKEGLVFKNTTQALQYLAQDQSDYHK
ncbi:SulP family inorganic anion transporter [Candidatus Babeliales bacterium]|nr:SulP family inorganic anion transporter [Candidatus Babeliales bacterium]MBP9844365.1 SulP family inorganic anion transporter [Candidatus Babeliales bacterium]